MSNVIEKPTQIEACGNKPKIIKEYIGCVNSQTEEVSIAHMTSPAGWEEPGQTPEFDEYTVVTKGSLQVKTKDSTQCIRAGQAYIAKKGVWVQYSTPDEPGAEYMAVCIPAFTPDSVHRDE